MVFQQFNLFPHLTVMRQRHARRAAGPQAAAGRGRGARRRELLERVGLAEKADAHPRPALGRPAAARRDRAGAGDAARRSCSSTRSRRALDPELVGEVLAVMRDLARGAA